MAVFGGYETVRQFSASASHAVWTARPAGAAGEPLYAIKQIRLEEIVDLLGAEDAERAIEGLYQAACVQERLAKVEGSRWAAIHVKAKSKDGAYCVTDLFFDGGVPSSAQSLIRGAGSTRLTHQTLRAVVEAVAQGMAQIHALGRPHGRLKATNVLIAWAGDVPSRVLLTDPAADAAVARRDAEDDITALGELIYELVLKRPYASRGGWPLPQDDAWRALGSTGEAWRKLCEELLNPARKPGEIKAEDIPAMLPVEQSGGPSKRTLIAAGAGGLLLVIIAVVAMVNVFGGGGGDEDGGSVTPEEWISLINHDETWLAGLRQRLREGDQRIGDPALALALRDIFTEHGVPPSDTRQLAEIFLAESDSNRYTRSNGYEDERASAKAAKFLPAVASLTEAIRSWPARVRMVEAAEVAEALGMPLRAADLRQRGAELGEQATGQEIVAHVDAVAGGLRVVDRLTTLGESVARLTGRGAELNDPVLSRIGEVVAERDSMAPLEQLERFAATLAGVEQALARGLFQDDAARRALLARAAELAGPTDRPITTETLNQWETATRSDEFQPLAGESPIEGWRARLARVSRSLDAMTFDAVAQEKRADCVRQRESAHARASEAAGLIDQNAGVGRIRMYEAEHQRLGAEIQRRLDELEAHVATLARCGLADPNEIRRTMAQSDASRVPSGSAVVQAEYRRRLDDARQRYSDEAIEGAFDALVTLFGGLDESTMVSTQGAERFAATLRTQREQALTAFFAEPAWRQAWEGGGAPPPLATFSESLASIRENLAARAARAMAVAAEADRMKAMIDDARSFDEEARRAAAQFVQDSAEFRAELSTLLGTITSLEGVWGASRRGDTTALAAIIERGEVTPAVALEAWRGLERVEGGGTGLSLAQTASLRERLIGLAGGVGSEARRREIIEDIRATARQRWVTQARAAPTMAEFESAVDLAPRFDVSRSTVEDAAIAYNWLVVEFARTAIEARTAGANDEAVRGHTRSFLDEAAPLAQRAFGRAPAVLSQMEELIRPSETPPPPKGSELGPASLENSPWQATMLGGAVEAVRFTWEVAAGSANRTHTLDFVLVEPSSGPPAYVSTTEVSLGLFLDLFTGGQPMAQSTVWALHREVMQRSRDRFTAPETPSDRGTGPHVWVWGAPDERRPTYWRINVSPTWVVPTTEFQVTLNDQRSPLPPYPLEIFQKIEGEQKPTLEHPMHWIRPDAAVLAAWLAGCRLPTSDEWRAALALNVRVANDAQMDLSRLGIVTPRETPNRRDDLGRQQLDYARANRNAAATFVRPDQRSLWEGVASGLEHWPETAVDGDDTFWFAPVTSGGGLFRHLIGNVAEMALAPDLAEAIDAARATATGGPTTAAARQFVLSREDAVGVIGASAQAPNDHDPATFLDTFVSSAGLDKLGGADWRFADVGFRLAFSSGGAARPRPLAERLAALLAESSPYHRAQ